MTDTLRQFIIRLFGLRRGPIVKVYDGYGDADDLMVQGHVLRYGPGTSGKYRRSWIANTFSLLRLFMVKPMAHVPVVVEWMGEQHRTHTDNAGFFRVEWRPTSSAGPGWHPVTARLEHGKASGMARLFWPHSGQCAVISDIDDTFLISHSSNLRKRLFVLLTENAISRMPFENVVDHYRALSIGTGNTAEPNPFFYVSSPEWNLYDYIKAFCKEHGIPEGILLLSPLKELGNVWRTGQGKHEAKAGRIERIMRAYPQHSYILLGDDTQQDPFIYAGIVERMPGRVRAVYLRRVRKSVSKEVQQQIDRMRAAGVECCYFTHSREAIEHSRAIGLIT
jgi:phosphatidate phosphatase APP1